MKKNKNVVDVEEYSVTFSICANGEKIKLTEKQKIEMRDNIQKSLEPGQTCVMQGWKEDAALFKRPNKSKRFTEKEANEIKTAPGSIRKKANIYDASTKTIWLIMNDKYYD